MSVPFWSCGLNLRGALFSDSCQRTSLMLCAVLGISVITGTASPSLSKYFIFQWLSIWEHYHIAPVLISPYVSVEMELGEE